MANPTMTELTLSSSFSVHPLASIKLPQVVGDPGPLHTIVQDERHNIYYSDEINNSVVSLSALGEIRWHRSKLGKDPAQFHYPKGIDLGWISDGGSRTECLAICDSWNRRIQFFDPDGNFLKAWGSAGDFNFSDVVDVRFIRSETSPYWLILDRGLHTLFGMDLSGNMVFRTGRCFPENLESRWLIPIDSSAGQATFADRFSACLPYDPVFFPSRIFGNTPEALFIWEPKSRRLKQEVSGNLLPVWIDLPQEAEWVGADAFGFLSHDISTGSLGFYNLAAKSWQSESIEGKPVPSSRKSGEVWTQDDSVILRWSYASGVEEERELKNKRSWMLCRLMNEIETVMSRQAKSARMEQLHNTAAELRKVSRRIIEILAGNWSELAGIERERKSLASSAHAMAEAVAAIKEDVHHTVVGLLKIQAFKSQCSSNEDRRCINQAFESIETTARELERLFKEMLLFKDEWFMTRVATTSTEENPSDTLGLLLQECYNRLLNASIDLSKDLWCVSLLDANKIDSKHSESKNSQSYACESAKFHSPISLKNTGYLREIDRINVSDDVDGSYAGPAAICYRPGIGYYVSLYNSRRIVRLDESGRMLGDVKLPSIPNSKFGRPQGIAVDDVGRIWVSIPSEDRIEIIDEAKNQRQSLEELAGESLGLKWPVGIYRTSTGQMLIADTLNNRILAANADGRVTTLVNGEGSNRGKLRHPNAFCDSNEKAEFWAVEIRNHRLQRFNSDGQPLGEIGGLGFREGELVLPDSAAIFEDGTLAVSQWLCLRALVMFSKTGNEILPVNYYPQGVSAQKSILLVCEGFGNHIRVYERI